MNLIHGMLIVIIEFLVCLSIFLYIVLQRFNYRATHYMVTNGFYNFLNWFDERAWYPLGRIVGGTVYPGLMLTSGLIHYILDILHIPIHIRDICVFLAPIFSGLTAIATYLLTKELWNESAGLFAACFIAIGLFVIVIA